jgi:hypothetical protein
MDCSICRLVLECTILSGPVDMGGLAIQIPILMNASSASGLSDQRAVCLSHTAKRPL